MGAPQQIIPTPAHLEPDHRTQSGRGRKSTTEAQGVHITARVQAAITACSLCMARTKGAAVSKLGGRSQILWDTMNAFNLLSALLVSVDEITRVYCLLRPAPPRLDTSSRGLSKLISQALIHNLQLSTSVHCPSTGIITWLNVPRKHHLLVMSTFDYSPHPRTRMRRGIISLQNVPLK